MKSWFLLSALTFFWIFAGFSFAQEQTSPPPPQSSSPKALQLLCKGGLRVHGLIDRWSPWSTCPKSYQVTGLQRIDLLGPHSNPTAHVNDFQCNDQGCRAWCIGSACTVEARCCAVRLGDEAE